MIFSLPKTTTLPLVSLLIFTGCARDEPTKAKEKRSWAKCFGLVMLVFGEQVNVEMAKVDETWPCVRSVIENRSLSNNLCQFWLNVSLS